MATRLDRVTRAFALLIGIDDYSVHDASAGNPAGTSDLPASKNDVGSCYRICRAPGIPPENIHVLTTPGLTPDDFGEPGKAMKPGYAGLATRAEIEAQVAWLAGVLEHAPGDTDAPVGLLTYSGHGDFVDGFLALCPSDVRKGGDAATGDLEGALGFPRLQAIVAGKRGAAESLTVVIDCCHAAAAAAVVPGKPARLRARSSLTGRARTAAGPITAFGDRMIMAAEPGQTADQSTFDGRPHGALTWALSVVTDQWTVLAEGDVDRFTITHGELRDRAQRLFGALDFSQQIALFPPMIAPIPFFHRGAADGPDVVASAPDRARHGIQLDPNQHDGFSVYALTISYTGDGAEYHHTAQVLSAGSDSPSWGVRRRQGVLGRGQPLCQRVRVHPGPPKDAGGHPPEPGSPGHRQRGLAARGADPPRRRLPLGHEHNQQLFYDGSFGLARGRRATRTDSRFRPPAPPGAGLSSTRASSSPTRSAPTPSRSRARRTASIHSRSRSSSPPPARRRRAASTSRSRRTRDLR